MIAWVGYKLERVQSCGVVVHCCTGVAPVAAAAVVGVADAAGRTSQCVCSLCVNACRGLVQMWMINNTNNIM